MTSRCRAQQRRVDARAACRMPLEKIAALGRSASTAVSSMRRPRARARGAQIHAGIDDIDLTDPGPTPPGSKTWSAKLDGKVDHLPVTPACSPALPGRLEFEIERRLSAPPARLTLGYASAATRPGAWRKHWSSSPKGWRASSSTSPTGRPVTGTLDVDATERRMTTLSPWTWPADSRERARHGPGKVDGEKKADGVELTSWRPTTCRWTRRSSRRCRRRVGSWRGSSCPSASRQMRAGGAAHGPGRLQGVHPHGPERARASPTASSSTSTTPPLRYDLFPYPLEKVSGVLDCCPTTGSAATSAAAQGRRDSGRRPLVPRSRGRVAGTRRAASDLVQVVDPGPRRAARPGVRAGAVAAGPRRPGDPAKHLADAGLARPAQLRRRGRGRARTSPRTSTWAWRSRLLHAAASSSRTPWTSVSGRGALRARPGLPDRRAARHGPSGSA